MKRKREQIKAKARVKRQRKIVNPEPDTVQEDLVADIGSQVKEAASIAVEKVGDIVKTATEAVKVAVTKKRFH